jgi:hypothetical protein
LLPPAAAEKLFHFLVEANTEYEGCQERDGREPREQIVDIQILDFRVEI